MKKIPVCILGATGMVGQRFVQMLVDHPMFEIAALSASERSCGQTYAESCKWIINGDMPNSVREMIVYPIQPNIPGLIAFSALPASIAKDVEPIFAHAGYAVSSNASAYRQEPDVPLIIPEVNPDHLILINRQQKERGWKGFIITCPNCTTTGIAMTLTPLHRAFDIRRVFVVSMQAISGAGYPGHPYLDIYDNVIPFIDGEEEKIEIESRLILGKIENSQRYPASFILSAQANRVPVIDGHTICISIEFDKKPDIHEITYLLSNFHGPEFINQAPSAPIHPIIVNYEKNRPQPRKDRDIEKGMTVVIGRIRPCPILDYKMVTVVHNAIRGAAGGAILNAELLVVNGYLS